MLHFRAQSDSGIRGVPECVLDNLRYFDADGRELKVFQDAKSTAESMIQGSPCDGVSPNFPANDEVIRIMQPDAQPRGGWSKVKMPLVVTGLVSDGECWPTPFKVKLRPQKGEMRDYTG